MIWKKIHRFIYRKKYREEVVQQAIEALEQESGAVKNKTQLNFGALSDAQKEMWSRALWPQAVQNTATYMQLINEQQLRDMRFSAYKQQNVYEQKVRDCYEHARKRT